MDYKVIKTDDQYEATLAVAEQLIACDPDIGTDEAERLELLSLLIEDYEKRNFPFRKPDPIGAIRFRMEEQGLRQADLAPLLGSRSRVSEVLAGKRPLTVQMIRALSTAFEQKTLFALNQISWFSFLVSDVSSRILVFFAQCGRI